MDEVLRYDAKQTMRVKPLAGGGVAIDGRLTRAGVFAYKLSDGTMRKELRPTEEVFAEDSLETLKHAPVTVDHPASPVRSETWRTDSVGHVGEQVRPEGVFVAANVVVNDAGALKRIEAKELREISCGYVCRYDATPGVYQGERYDGVQREIRYNHVAIGPAGWGRAGSQVALRLDSGDAVIVDECATEEKIMKVVRIDGVEYEVGSDAHMAKLDAMHASQVAAVSAERDKAQGRADAAEKALAATEAKLASATDPKAIAAAVKSRVSTLASCKAVMGDRFDSEAASAMTELDAMVAALKANDATFDATGKSDDYVRGLFEGVAKSAAAAASAAHDSAASARPAPRADAKGTEPTEYEKAVAAQKDRLHNAWKQPLS